MEEEQVLLVLVPEVVVIVKGVVVVVVVVVVVEVLIVHDSLTRHERACSTHVPLLGIDYSDEASRRPGVVPSQQQVVAHLQTLHR